MDYTRYLLEDLKTQDNRLILDTYDFLYLLTTRPHHFKYALPSCKKAELSDLIHFYEHIFDEYYKFWQVNRIDISPNLSAFLLLLQALTYISEDNRWYTSFSNLFFNNSEPSIDFLNMLVASPYLNTFAPPVAFVFDYFLDFAARNGIRSSTMTAYLSADDPLLPVDQYGILKKPTDPEKYKLYKANFKVAIKDFLLSHGFKLSILKEEIKEKAPEKGLNIELLR